MHVVLNIYLRPKYIAQIAVILKTSGEVINVHSVKMTIRLL